MGKRYSVGIVGEANYQEAIGALREGETVALVPEPDNPHDPRAISVRDDNGAPIGYLPRGHWLTAAMLDEGKAVAAQVKSIEGGDRGRPSLGVVIEVDVGGKDAAPAPVSAAQPPGKPSDARAIGCGALVALALIVAMCGGGDDGGSPALDDSTPGAGGANAVSADAEPSAADLLTAPQRNARRNAESYLQMSGFSRQGLIDQLSSDAGNGYAVADATAAVDSLDADWNAQAARSAASYLEMTGFSCQGLIEQLSSPSGSQYTEAEARYGAQQAGAC